MINNKINIEKLNIEKLNVENLNVEMLIKLKLIIENDIITLAESNKQAKTIELNNKSEDLDIYTIFAIYENNIEILGHELFVKQNDLLNIINSVLSRKCIHRWIDNKNYCIKCFINKEII